MAGARVLLVEDNEMNRDMLSRRLARQGYTVTTAVDGEQGVEMAARTLPELILMDMSLPVMDGWEATRRLKAAEATRGIPVIALTAHAMSDDRSKALEAGCDEYDTKPVELPRLLQKMEAMLSPDRLAGSKMPQILLALILLLAAWFPQAATAGDIAVVVRPDTPADNLSLREMRALLLGERPFWNSSLRVTLLLRAPAAREREVVLRVVYRMNEAQFRQYWISKVFRAETSNGPKIVYSSQMANDLIAALPGSVSFMDVADVPRELKVVRIDGKAPGDEGYRLK